MSMVTPFRALRVIGGFALFAVAAMLLSPLFGAEKINVGRALAEWLGGIFSAGDAGGSASTDIDILIQLRLPRIALAFMVGSALAIVGTVFQALLRNPLATPYTLGVSGGGAFGAVAGIFIPTLLPWLAFSWGPFNQVQCLAFAGALLAVVMIYLLARTGGRVSTMELLLAGVTMGMIFGALILAIRYFTKPQMLVDMDRWMMGRLDVGGWSTVFPVLTFLVPGLVVLMLLARGLDQISFGEELARGRGVNVHRLQQLAFFGGSLATASVVAVAGPIGFVGLIVPHTIRRMIGPDHRLLLPSAFFAGGGFLVICDTFARTIIAPTELPVGIITSLMGGPFFIYLLIRSRQRGGFGN